MALHRPISKREEQSKSMDPRPDVMSRMHFLPSTLLRSSLRVPSQAFCHALCHLRHLCDIATTCLLNSALTCRQVETQRMQQVLAHPDFQANPLAAIKSHLAATLPDPVPAKVQPRLKTPQQRRQQKRATQHASMDET